MRHAALVVALATTPALSGCIAAMGAVGAGVGQGMNSYVDARNGQPVRQDFPPGTRRAAFTGRDEFTTSVTGRPAINCEYDYAGQRFVQTFLGNRCPNAVAVQ